MHRQNTKFSYSSKVSDGNIIVIDGINPLIQLPFISCNGITVTVKGNTICSHNKTVASSGYIILQQGAAGYSSTSCNAGIDYHPKFCRCSRTDTYIITNVHLRRPGFTLNRFFFGKYSVYTAAGRKFSVIRADLLWGYRSIIDVEVINITIKINACIFVPSDNYCRGQGPISFCRNHYIIKTSVNIKFNGISRIIKGYRNMVPLIFIPQPVFC